MNVLICTTYNYKRTRKLIAFIHELLVLESEMGTHCSSSAGKSSCFLHQAETKEVESFDYYVIFTMKNCLLQTLAFQKIFTFKELNNK
jgi:hypothetical protein